MTLPDSASTTDSSWLTPAEPADEAVTMPQTLAGVFDESFDLYKRHFGLLATIVAVGVIPFEILRNTIIALWLHPLDAHLSGAATATPDMIFLLRLGQFCFGDSHAGFPGVLYYMVLILLSAPISVAVSDLYFGRNTTVRDCYRRSRPYLLQMIWGYCLIVFLTLGIAVGGGIVGGLPGLLIAALLAGAGVPEIGSVIFVLFLALVYCFWAGIIARGFLFMTPLAVLEGLPVSFVGYRNYQLVGKTRLWRTSAAVAALPVLAIGFQTVLSLSLGGAMETMHLAPMANFVLVSAVGEATHFFLAPYWTIFVTLLYYDYRVRREGFDVRVLSLANAAALEKEAES